MVPRGHLTWRRSFGHRSHASAFVSCHPISTAEYWWLFKGSHAVSAPINLHPCCLQRSQSRSCRWITHFEDNLAFAYNLRNNILQHATRSLLWSYSWDLRYIQDAASLHSRSCLRRFHSRPWSQIKTCLCTCSTAACSICYRYWAVLFQHLWPAYDLHPVPYSRCQRERQVSSISVAPVRCLCHSSFVMSFHSGWWLWSLDQTYSVFDQKSGDREVDCSSSFGIWVCHLRHVSRRIWRRWRCFDTFCSSLWLWRTRIGCCAKGSRIENCKRPIPILGRWLVMRICNILASVSRLA